MIPNYNEPLTTCPICEGPVVEPPWARSNRDRCVSCPACGDIILTFEALVDSNGLSRQQRVMLAGFLRHESEASHRPFRLVQDHVDHPEVSLGLVPKSVTERISATLKALADKSYHFGASVLARPQHDWTLGWCTGKDEFQAILNHLVESDQIEVESPNPGDPEGAQGYSVTAGGWAQVEAEATRNQIVPKKAFVAMSFADDLVPAWTEGFFPAISAAGFTPFRIDRQQFNDKICDRILAEIRSCGLLVADFTHHRGGVYFEAGFALGLGKPVVWTCQKADIEAAHFDTRQYNHVVWTDAADLRGQLEDRIRATVPAPSEAG